MNYLVPTIDLDRLLMAPTAERWYSASLDEALDRPAIAHGCLGSASSYIMQSDELLISGQQSKTFWQHLAADRDLAERLFDCLVHLKVAVSEYAMHLSTPDRLRLFEELDEILNEDDWHEEDPLPTVESFRCFLRWSLFAKRFDWTGLGISSQGDTLAAWSTASLDLTADFQPDETVRWTARKQSRSGLEFAAGKSSLQYFASQAAFYFNEDPKL